MIDPERMLGAFVGAIASPEHAVYRQQQGGVSTAAVGTGLLGLALGAYDSNSKRAVLSSQTGGGGNAPSVPRSSSTMGSTQSVSPALPAEEPSQQFARRFRLLRKLHWREPEIKHCCLFGR